MQPSVPDVRTPYGPGDTMFDFHTIIGLASEDEISLLARQQENSPGTPAEGMRRNTHGEQPQSQCESRQCESRQFVMISSRN